MNTIITLAIVGGIIIGMILLIKWSNPFEYDKETLEWKKQQESEEEE